MLAEAGCLPALQGCLNQPKALVSSGGDRGHVASAARCYKRLRRMAYQVHGRWWLDGTSKHMKDEKVRCLWFADPVAMLANLREFQQFGYWPGLVFLGLKFCR